MARTYPFLDRVNEALKTKDKTLKWLADEIGRSDRWFYSIKEFEKIEYGLLAKISSILEINFITDYDNWREAKGETKYLLAEPPALYKKEREITVAITIKGTVKTFGNGFEELLKKIEKEGEKAGFIIE